MITFNGLAQGISNACKTLLDEVFNDPGPVLPRDMVFNEGKTPQEFLNSQCNDPFKFCQNPWSSNQNQYNNSLNDDKLSNSSTFDQEAGIFTDTTSSTPVLNANDNTNLSNDNLIFTQNNGPSSELGVIKSDLEKLKVAAEKTDKIKPIYDCSKILVDAIEKITNDSEEDSAAIKEMAKTFIAFGEFSEKVFDVFQNGTKKEALNFSNSAKNLADRFAFDPTKTTLELANDFSHAIADVGQFLGETTLLLCFNPELPADNMQNSFDLLKKRIEPLTRRQLAEESVAFIAQTMFSFASLSAIPVVGNSLGVQEAVSASKIVTEGAINIFKTEESLIGPALKTEKAKRLTTPVTSVFAEAGAHIQKRIETIKEQISNVKNMLLKDPEFMTSLIPGKTAGEKVKNFFRGMRKKGLKFIAEAEGCDIKMDFDVAAGKEYEKIKKLGNTFEKTQKTNINAKSFEEGVGEKNVFGGGKKVDDATKNVGKKVEWTPHDYKHFPKKNLSWKETVESTKSSTIGAKYKPEINIEKLERHVWETGTPVTTGKSWKVKAFDYVCGACDGKETKYMRVEESAGVIHGHPITETEYKKLTKIHDKK